jgi:hypothetical protein
MRTEVLKRDMAKNLNSGGAEFSILNVSLEFG